MIGTNNDDNGKTELGNRKMKLVKTSVEFSEMPLKVCLASTPQAGRRSNE